MGNPIQWSDLVTLVGVVAIVLGGVWRAATMIADLRQELAVYKVEVAEKYVSAVAMRELEDRLANAIERLGDRLDRVFDQGRT